MSRKANTINEKDSQSVKERKEYYNTIVCDKKPYFFIYVYDSLKKEHNAFQRNENKRCLREFGKTLNEVLNNPTTEEEHRMIYYYHQNKIVDETPSVMNKISWYVENEFKNFKLPKIDNNDFIELLKTSKGYKKSHYNKIVPLYDDYIKAIKKTKNDSLLNNSKSSEVNAHKETLFNSLKDRLLTICSNREELCNIVIDMCYKKNGSSKHFAWAMCGDQIIQNLLAKSNKTFSYPIMTDEEKHDFEYKGYKFKMITREYE